MEDHMGLEISDWRSEEKAQKGTEERRRACFASHAAFRSEE
jgi:hypothetical protein